jgi:hypothetical protein
MDQIDSHNNWLKEGNALHPPHSNCSKSSKFARFTPKKHCFDGFFGVA